MVSNTVHNGNSDVVDHRPTKEKRQQRNVEVRSDVHVFGGPCRNKSIK
jgi:hypothetical protein